MAAPVLASDVMDQAAALLNDTARDLYSNTVQLPYLRKANEDLELLLIDLGQNPVTKAVSIPLDVDADTTGSITLASPPSDLFVPIHVWERAQGSSDDWSLMDEKAWEEDVAVGSTLGAWTFRNNNIYFPPCSADREVKLDYWRQLNAIASASSAEEVVGSKTYLSAKTAELCARYVGENEDRANAILNVEVIPCRERLENIYVKNSQGLRSRRRRFTRRRTPIYTR